MKKLSLGMGAWVGGLLTASLIGVMYLANQLVGLPFVPFDLFDWLTRVLPGPLITFGIDRMIDTITWLGRDVADVAKTAEQAMAILQFFVMGVVASALFWAIMSVRRLKADLTASLVIGALTSLPMIANSIAIGQSTLNPGWRILWLLVLFFAWAWTFCWAYRRLQPPEDSPLAPESETRSVEILNRRQFLVRLGASTAAITVVGAGVGVMLAQAKQRQLEAALAGSMAHQVDETPQSSFPNANDPVMPVPGMRPEYTPVKDHYKVFLRTEPTVIDGATWVLPITGLVEKPVMLTLADLRKYLQKLLADIKPKPNARYLYITCGDGFYETVDLDLIAADERIMLCYAWGGNTLPVDHGFPLRIWIPDRYGMKQPKWITGIEVTDEDRPGYWVERGWDKVAQVKTTSVIDTVAVDALVDNGGQKLVPVGGIAFAGARGISKVEVRVDGGPWQEARLRQPLSETTWVIWRYDWPFASGDHAFEVCCAEGDGTPQIEESRSNRPSGATGIHHRDVTL
ncbi:MAG: molybdopterin-dependent oxidoreductase [Chloroflexi bacterium]|nr:molybdopterin-dependent oxidoreductase [Chloroflexota bacterium]